MRPRPMGSLLTEAARTARRSRARAMPLVSGPSPTARAPPGRRAARQHTHAHVQDTGSKHGQAVPFAEMIAATQCMGTAANLTPHTILTHNNNNAANMSRHQPTHGSAGPAWAAAAPAGGPPPVLLPLGTGCGGSTGRRPAGWGRGVGHTWLPHAGAAGRPSSPPGGLPGTGCGGRRGGWVRGLVKRERHGGGGGWACQAGASCLVSCHASAMPV
jgi:hypothetical protein